MDNRVVITSTGLVSSIGNCEGEVLSAFKENKVNFTSSKIFEGLRECPIDNFEIKKITGRMKNARYLNRGASFAVAAAFMAITNSGLTEEFLQQAGILIGSGPNFNISEDFPKLSEGNMDSQKLQALWILKYLPNTASSVIANLFSIHGESLTIGTACAASLQAIGEGFRKIKHGYLDRAVILGGDSRLSHGGLLAYKKASALFVEESQDDLYIPYGINQKGFIPGEGGGSIVLESLDSALKRGAHIIGEIIGHGASVDGYNMTAPSPTGEFAEKAVYDALNSAGIQAKDINMISAHGTGTVLNDQMESALIERTYGNGPVITSYKSWIGHLSSSCGIVETILSLYSMNNNFVPAIRNINEVINPNINILKKAHVANIKHVALHNFGFGGQNAVLILKKWEK